MTLEKALSYYKALTELSQIELDYTSAYALVRLKKKLKGHIDFFTEEEMKLVQTYGKKNECGIVEWNEDGTFYFEDAAQAQEYSQKRKELGDVELDDTVDEVSIVPPKKMRPTLIEALDGLVTFEGAER